MTVSQIVATTVATVRGSHATWATCRSTSTDCWSGTGNGGGYLFSEESGGLYTVMRVACVFDTSSLPHGAVVTAAELRVYSRVLKTDGTAATVTSMTATTPICDNTEANYDAALAGAVVGSIEPAEVEVWLGCDIATTAIVVGGTTTLALVETTTDLANSAPGAGEVYGFNIDDDGGVNPPELWVTYYVPSTAATKLDTNDSRLWLLDCDRALVQLVTDWKDFSLDLGLFGAGTLTVTLHKDSITGTNDGEGAVATNFGWTGTKGLMSLDYYHRGTKVFSGPIQTVVKQHEGPEGTAYVTVTAETWGPALLRRRQVRTTTGAPFTVVNDSWRDIGRKLIEEQCENGSIVTPTGWQQNSETRDDFGSFTVTVANKGDSGTEDYTCPVRTNLWDAVCELCNIPATDAEKLWVYWTESSAGTFNFDFYVGRSGGSRAIGTDKTGTVIFASQRGEVERWELTLDGAATENHLVSGGDGPGAGQSVRHAANDTSITTRNLGVYEGVEDVPGGRQSYEMDNELRRALGDRADIRTWQAAITETAAQTWPSSFGITDSVTIYDAHYAETVSDMIVGVKLSYPAPGPYKLDLVFGKMPRNELKGVARSGGGGGGGRGGGGKSKNKDGTRYVYDHFTGTAGSATAHEAQTGIGFTGTVGTELRAITTASDTSTDGADDGLVISLEGDYISGTGQAATGYVKLINSAGGNFWALVTNVDPLAP